MRSLSAVFKKWQDNYHQARDRKKTAQSVAACIRAGAAQEIPLMLAKVENRQAFLEKYYKPLMTQAIDKGDMDCFLAFYQFAGNPNYQMVFQYSNGREVYTTYKTPLCYAVENNKVFIAAHIAEDPNTDPDNEKTLNLVAAKVKAGEGLDGVQITLLRRLAENKRQEAADLEARAGGVNPS